MRTTDTLKTHRSLKDTTFEISYKTFFCSAIIYLTLPVIIFFIGYLKPVWAILFTALTVGAGIYVLKDSAKGPDGDTKEAEKFTLKFDFKFLAVMIPMILIIVFISGVGEFAFTLSDHSIRYAILNDLVEYKWPIIYDFATQENHVVSAYLGEGKVAFAYYFVYWMVPAVIGKVAGLMTARIALFLWSALGLFLIAVGASMLYGKASRALFLGLWLFAGFDVIPYALNNLVGNWATWERWNAHLIVVGNTYQLMNVFNQAIPGWLITILLIMCVNSRSIGYLGALMFVYSPWAAIGILPMCICKIVMKCGKKVIRNLFTIGNIVTPIVFFVCFAAFFTANSNATDEDGFILKFYPTVWRFVRDYLAYIFVEFGVWFLMIYKRQKNNPLMWTAIGTLLVLPFYKITYANDFLMRGSMAPLFMVSLYAVMFVTDYFHECLHGKKFVLKTRLPVLALILAAYTSFNLILYSSLMTFEVNFMGAEDEDISHDIVSFGNIRKEDQVEVINTQFFVYEYEDTVFFKYLARS